MWQTPAVVEEVLRALAGRAQPLTQLSLAGTGSGRSFSLGLDLAVSLGALAVSESLVRATLIMLLALAIGAFGVALTRPTTADPQAMPRLTRWSPADSSAEGGAVTDAAVGPAAAAGIAALPPAGGLAVRGLLRLRVVIGGRPRPVVRRIRPGRLGE